MSGAYLVLKIVFWKRIALFWHDWSKSTAKRKFVGLFEVFEGAVGDQRRVSGCGVVAGSFWVGGRVVGWFGRTGHPRDG